MNATQTPEYQAGYFAGKRDTEARFSKPSLEMLNLRKRVEAQREEIHKLQLKCKNLEEELRGRT